MSKVNDGRRFEIHCDGGCGAVLADRAYVGEEWNDMLADLREAKWRSARDPAKGQWTHTCWDCRDDFSARRVKNDENG